MSKRRSDLSTQDANRNDISLLELLKEDLPLFVETALRGDPYRTTIAARRLVGRIGEVAPQVSAAIQQRLVATRAGTQSVREARRVEPGLDDTGNLLTLRPAGESPRPTLSSSVNADLEGFLREHSGSEALRARGLEPRWTVLLTGPPGVGKTMLARWIASRLGVPLAELHLSTAISSFLGKTGQNLRDALDIARREPMVLLLDEFDALAKRRDDATDLGELKRVVSVLLKELEEWCGPSIIIAATNHPEMLDPAVFRRFQLSMALALPDTESAAEILLAQFQPNGARPEVLRLVAEVMRGSSGSDLRQFAQNSQRVALLEDIPIDEAVLRDIAKRLEKTAERKAFCRLAVKILPRGDRSMDRLARLIGVAKSTVHSYLSE